MSRCCDCQPAEAEDLQQVRAEWSISDESTPTLQQTLNCSWTVHTETQTVLWSISFSVLKLISIIFMRTARIYAALFDYLFIHITENSESFSDMHGNPELISGSCMQSPTRLHRPEFTMLDSSWYIVCIYLTGCVFGYVLYYSSFIHSDDSFYLVLVRSMINCLMWEVPHIMTAGSVMLSKKHRPCWPASWK